MSDPSSHSFEFTSANIEHLDELIRTIECKYSNTKDKSSSSDDVNGIFYRCQQSVQKYSDTHRLKENSLQFFENNYLVKLVHLLREAILSHQWTDAFKIVNALVKEGDKVADILWKVGMVSLILEKKSKPIDLYVRQLCSITKLSSVEVLFDYLLYLLLEGNFERARDLLQNLNAEEETQSANINYVKILFRAYIGLIDYLHWKAEISQDNTEHESALDFMSSKLSQGISHRSSKAKAERAISNLSCIRGIPGVWDIFIIKMLEIHEFYDDLDAARSLLKSYRAENPDNLNAHRYLYKFEMRHEEKPEGILQNLKNIVRLDPSNPVALDLYKDMVSSDVEAVSILFDYLDFHHCKNDLQAWKLLETHLSEVKGKAKGSEDVTKCWMLRKDWWPSTSLQIDDDSDNFKQLAKVKKKVHRSLMTYFCQEMP